MWCRLKLLVVSVLSTHIQAAYSPGNFAIQWVQSQGKATGATVKPPVLAPKGFAGHFRGLAPPQKLMLRYPTDDESPKTSPHFTFNPDGSIVWGGLGWCIGVAEEHEENVYVDKCTGGLAQKWNWIPDGLGRNRIQLRNTGRCLVADSAGGWNGIPVVLRDCQSQLTEAWKLEELDVLPTQSTVLNELRHVLISLVALAGVGALSVGAWFWQTRTKKEQLATMTQHGVHASAEQEMGVSIAATSVVVESMNDNNTLNRLQSANVRCGKVSMSAGSAQEPEEAQKTETIPDWKAVVAAAALSLAVGVQSASAGPFTRSEIATLTYDQIKGTGLANTCPRVESASEGSIKVGDKKLKIEEFCLEPTSFQVLEEKVTSLAVIEEPVNTKITTRQTSVLTGIEGDLLSENGKIVFQEKDGIDFAPTTAQVPGGERVPFLFTVKNLVAKSDGPASEIQKDLQLSGRFTVPSYHTGIFLDPKGQGTTTGIDEAVEFPALQESGDDSVSLADRGTKTVLDRAVALSALQSSGDEPVLLAFNTRFDVGHGSIHLKVTEVNSELGEFGGVFEQKQPSDNACGSKLPKEVLIKGKFFGTVQE